MFVAKSRFWKLLSVGCVLSVFSCWNLAFSGFAASSSEIQPSPPVIQWVKGPKMVDLKDGMASLNVPAGYVFADAKDTQALMDYYGNSVDGSEIGSVHPESGDWFLLYEYEESGHIKDDDQKIDADELLQQIKDGTEQQNKAKKDEGIDDVITIKGWDEAPHYNAQTKFLEWSILADANGNPLVNYDVRVLGRTGVTTITFVGSPDDLKAMKPKLNGIITGLSYKSGNKYEEFDPNLDKVAEYGLAALVAGGAGAVAAKTGFFAAAILLLKKIWFLIIAAVIGAFRWFKNRVNGSQHQTNESFTASSESDVQNPIVPEDSSENDGSPKI